MAKRLAFLLLILCMLLGALPAAQADETTLILPLDTANTHAVLLCHEDHYALVGGSDAERITAQLKALHIPNLTCVVPLCDHTEHRGALGDLASQYGIPLVTANDAFALGNGALVWSEGLLTFASDAAAYAFGAEEAVPNHITFRCDGSLIAFQAETDEGSVNVRKEPSTKAKRSGKLKRGEILTILSMVHNAKNEMWYAVRLEDGTEGFIRHDLLTYVSDDELALRAAATPTPKNDRYIGNKKSKVFHNPNCGSLPAAKNQVYFSSRSYAIATGYRPCSKCNP